WATRTTCPVSLPGTTNTSARAAGGPCWPSPRTRPGTRTRWRPPSMAAEPPTTPELLGKFGPLRAYQTGRRLDTGLDPDKLVKTHCCFCGQQCGIQLKVKDNQVVGFDAWLDFPFNQGMLCPKGVRRYLQSSHHDRLTSAYARDPSRPEGFRPVPYGEGGRRGAADAART